MSTWTNEKHEAARFLASERAAFGPNTKASLADALDEIERLRSQAASLGDDAAVERVAALLCANGRHESIWAMLDDAEREDFRVDARAVLRAVLSPDEVVSDSVVKPGMVIHTWPENDEHLRGWVLLDSDVPGDEWWWEPHRNDAPGYHWRFPNSFGFAAPEVGPWIVRRRAPLDYGYSEK